jgi:GTP1/Obg family GTP-binding protein
MAVWFLSTLHAEVRHLIKAVETQAVEIRQQARFSNKIVRIESDIAHIKQSLSKISEDSHKHSRAWLPQDATE